MRRITVKNVGPVKDARLELKKINILIGQQSTGKSTLAKIACYCSWVEKEISIAQSSADFEKKNYFAENLSRFHKLTGYITTDSFIGYDSDVLSFEYSNNKFSFRWNDGRLEYKRRKTLYIPAERNIISVIPNWFEVNLEFNSTRSFLADWERVRKYYSIKNPLPLLDFGNYYHNSSDGTDHIVTKDNVDLLIGNASSGLQTLTPMQALIKYYGDDYYDTNLKGKESSVSYLEKLVVLSNKIKNKISENISNEEFEKEHFELLENFYFPNSTSFFIEEPELNLYPVTQYKLMNSIIEMINSKDHSLFITTHSTYILTSLNNLIYAGEVGQANANDTEKVVPRNKWIDKKDVSAWKINAETNILHNLVEEDLAMLKAEELDDVSEIINSKFDKLFEIEHQAE